MTGTPGRDAWLSLTPEPERELPAAVATLRSGGRATDTAVGRERARVERLVVRARRRRWFAYLGEVVELIEAGAASSDTDVQRARAVALEVVQNHHGLLLGVWERAADRIAVERSRLRAVSQPANGGS